MKNTSKRHCLLGIQYVKGYEEPYKNTKHDMRSHTQEKAPQLVTPYFGDKSETVIAQSAFKDMTHSYTKCLAGIYMFPTFHQGS